MAEPYSFKAKAHLLKLLGDELIGDDRLAIFELVKNAYDADATKVDVLLDLKSEVSKIVVRDYEGHGMTKDDILNKWMEIGTDSKRSKNRRRTPRFERMPLGEKGVGRLAVHKLGRNLKLNTKAEGEEEIEVTIDWPSLIDNANYIEDTRVDISSNPKEPVFSSKETGTRIEITNLATLDWSRGNIRKLKRLLTSLVSPFNQVSDFIVNLEVPGREKDLVDVFTAQDVTDKSIWKFDFFINDDGGFSYVYQFNPPSLFKSLKGNVYEINDDVLELTVAPENGAGSRKKDNKNKIFVKKDDLENIGAISGSFYVHLRENKVLNALGAYQDIRNYLDEQSGVRVYRDGIRVFNYGEQGDDWLGLNVGRINRPGKKIANNMIIAGIDLDLESSHGLKEKTNREGFDENNDYIRYKWIISSVIDKFHLLHESDREKITQYIKDDRESSKPDPATRFSENIEDIQKKLKKHGLEKEIGGKVKQIELDYKQMREVTLSSGIAGLNLAVIFHEVERGVEDLNAAIAKGDTQKKLLERSDHLSKLLEGFTPLLRRNEQKDFKISSLVKRVIGLTEHRFEHHNVTISCPILTEECPDFEIRGPFGLLQAALNNLIDNSIHWTNYKAEIEGDEYKPAIRILTLTDWFQEGPALVIADNGPGFELTPEEAVQPFKTTRPAGMGVGLYYTDKVIETIGGSLLITSGQDLELPASYSGAAVVMIFKGVKV